MPGTAQGAAKATAARIAKRAQRAQSTSNDVGLDGCSLPVVHDVGTVVQSGQAVGGLLPKALRVCDEILDGKHKASAAVRANLAIEVLKQANRPAVAPGASAAVVSMLAALGKALGVRAPRTVEGESTVAPDEPVAG